MEPDKQKSEGEQIEKEKKLKKVKMIKEMISKAKEAQNKPKIHEEEEQQEQMNEMRQGDIEKVPTQPIQLPQTIQWCELNLREEKDLADFHGLIKNSAYEGDHKGFHYEYYKQFLKWSLNPPGFQPKWLIGIRNKQTKKLVGSITGVPITCIAQQTQIKMGLINLLSVHSELSGLKIQARLITQLSRRINLKNRWQAIYISDKKFRNPFARVFSYYRPLDPKKLLQANFMEHKKNHTLQIYNKIYKLPEQLTIQGLRPMGKKDVPGVTKLLNEQLKKFVVKFYYSEEEVKHLFLNKNMVMHTYVKEKQESEEKQDKKKKQFTDIISFYSFPALVLEENPHKTIKACKSFFNFATTVSFRELMKNALILAKNHEFDVYRCLNIMDNASVFDDLFFVRENEKNEFKYFFHNWNLKCGQIKPEQLGVIF